MIILAIPHNTAALFIINTSRAAQDCTRFGISFILFHAKLPIFPTESGISSSVIESLSGSRAKK